MFLLPSILVGSLLAVLPVLVHLWRRQRTTPVRWAAMQFLYTSKLTGRKSRKLQNWFLLLVRMLILATLAVLLARPFLASDYFAPLAQGQAMDVAIVIDHSLSMGRRTNSGDREGGAKPLFDQALDQAEQIRTLLREADTFSLVLAEHTPKVRTPPPAPVRKAAAAELIDALRQLPAPRTDCSIPEAVRAASELLERGPNTRKLLVILSDEQRAGFYMDSELAWRSALGGGVRTAETARKLPIYLITGNAGGSGGENLSVQPLVLGPKFVGVGRPLRVLATITNTSGTSHRKTTENAVQLLVDGQVMQTQTLPAVAGGESHTLRFDHRFPPGAGAGRGPGSHFVQVRTTLPDALEIDNTATAVVEVYDQLPVLLVDGTSTGSQFLMLALSVTELGMPALLQPKQITVAELGQVNLNDYPVTILNDPVWGAGPGALSGPVAGRLLEYVQTGHGLWLIMGPNVARSESFYKQELAKAGLFAGKLGARGQMKTVPPGDTDGSALGGGGLSVRLPEHDALMSLAQSAKDPLSAAVVQQWWQVQPDLTRQRVLISRSVSAEHKPAGVAGASGDGGAIVLEHDLGSLGGRVLLWTTCLEDGWSNLRFLPALVPLVHESIYHLAITAAQERSGGRFEQNLTAGAPLVYAQSAPNIGVVTLQLPDGQSKTLTPQVRGGKLLYTQEDTFQPGLYKLVATDDRQAVRRKRDMYYAVNLDRRELDPTTLSNADIQWLKEHYFIKDRLNSPRAVADVLGVSEGGLELWPYLAVLLLLLLLLETALTKHALRLQSPPHEKDGGVLLGVPAPVKGGRL